VVLDNLREGVLAADIYNPVLNRLYQHVLSHYGVVSMPFRIKDADRKGKVEPGVGHAQKTPLKGQRFDSLEQAQAYFDQWEQRWVDTRIHGTTKRQGARMFAEEKPFLQLLPIERFRYYQYGERGVHSDGCVEVKRAYYGLPLGWIGRLVKVQLTLCICGFSTPGVFSAYASMFARSLEKHYSKERLESAAARALRYSNLSLKPLRKILENELDRLEENPNVLTKYFGSKF
jgi:hypothetical protein